MGSQFSKTAIIILPPKITHLSYNIPLFSRYTTNFPDIFYPNTIAFIFILRHINFIKNGKQLQRGCCMSKNTILTGGICFLLVFLLLHPAESLSCARAGMTLWLNTLIPTLLPFIILTGMLTHTGHIRKLLLPFESFFHIFPGRHVHSESLTLFPLRFRNIFLFQRQIYPFYLEIFWKML